MYSRGEDMTKAERKRYEAEKIEGTRKAMWDCKQALTTEPEHSEAWEWARIGYNECARELGLPDFEALAA